MEAKKLRDISLGDIKTLAIGFTDEGQFTLSDAMEGKADIRAHIADHDEPDVQGAVAAVLKDKLEEAGTLGVAFETFLSMATVELEYLFA